MRISRKSVLALGSLLALSGVALGSAYFGAKFGQQYMLNCLCCLVPKNRDIVLTLREMIGLSDYRSQIGQDKWIAETVFPDLKGGFFVDVGSADGTFDSNTKALESRGWTGICIDPFPTNVEGRTCQMFKEVVYSVRGKQVTFRKAGGLGGIEDHLGQHKDKAATAEVVTFTTVTLGDILERAKAPAFIHYISIDIEGAEIEALRGFPFEKYTVGAFTRSSTTMRSRSALRSRTSSKPTVIVTSIPGFKTTISCARPRAIRGSRGRCHSKS